MEKTSVYLSERERRRLAELSRRLGRSQSEVIRAAIVEYDPGPDDDRAFTLSGIADGPGDSMADLDADLLLRGFGE